MAYTDGITSPEIFRLWSGIAAISGALERRVWVHTARSILYPNMFTLLVAAPGIGKSEVIKKVQELWYSAKSFRIAPDNVTKAALVDALAAADRKIITPSGLVEYHSLLVASPEFGVLVPSHDLEFLSVLNHIFDNPRVYRENRRTLAKNIEVIHPQVNILAGAQPGFLASLLPEEAWSMGFTSRLIMVYAGLTPVVPLFTELDDREHLFKRLLDRMVEFTKLMGPFKWTREAKSAMELWHKSGFDPAPTHSKLEHYLPRRVIHALKLCMVAAVSRSGELVITLEDFDRAREWMLGVELVMPDVFRDMVQKSDAQVIQELHWFMWQLYAGKKQPIHETRLIHFLQTKVPSEKVMRVLEVAERSGIICKMAGEKTYYPRGKHEWGHE